MSMVSLSFYEKSELLDMAEAAAALAYAPASHFRVGAALVAADGRVFTGCNIENMSLGLSICAERVAVFKAASEGARQFTQLAVVAAGGHDAPPCGACRQVLAELAPGVIVTYRCGGEIKSAAIEELLADPFRGTSE